MRTQTRAQLVSAQGLKDGITRLGSHNTLSSGSHVAHDCKVANRIMLGALSMVGGPLTTSSTLAE
jgi:acyl-[acyl carrier protein]--UDP-N-acetylglucosamine O-acyltransferase